MKEDRADPGEIDEPQAADESGTDDPGPPEMEYFEKGEKVPESRWNDLNGASDS